MVSVALDFSSKGAYPRVRNERVAMEEASSFGLA